MVVMGRDIRIHAGLIDCGSILPSRAFDITPTKRNGFFQAGRALSILNQSVSTHAPAAAGHLPRPQGCAHQCADEEDCKDETKVIGPKSYSSQTKSLLSPARSSWQGAGISAEVSRRSCG